MSQQAVTSLPFKIVLKGWLLTTRPRVLSIGAVPVIVGTLLTPLTLSLIEWSLMFCALLVAALIQTGTHCINDVLDKFKGADTSRRLGPLRGMHLGILPPQQVYWAGIACLALAFIAGIPLAIKGGIWVWVFLGISSVLGYLYTGGPYPLAYTGTSDLLVLPFFGWGIVITCAYVQSGEWGYLQLLAGTQLGLLATIPLLLNNYRDYHSDSLAHKKTTTVRFGIHFSRCEITMCLLVPYLLNLFWFPISLGAALLPFMTMPLALYIVLNIWRLEPSPVIQRFFSLGGATHALFGLLLAAGYRLW